jgi:hypothetical protein
MLVHPQTQYYAYTLKLQAISSNCRFWINEMLMSTSTEAQNPEAPVKTQAVGLEFARACSQMGLGPWTRAMEEC